MKCLVLAGGKGDRIWPLSRKNYPKQFIQIQKNHSVFQETIARNIPFCDEFIIVTNRDYEFIVENQMQVFQGITYRCIFEEIGRKTAAAIVLACLQFPLSELVFVTAADQIVEGDTYKDHILNGKKQAENGYLCTFGMQITEPETRFGYIHHKEDRVLAFVEKPDRETAAGFALRDDYLINSGMFLFRIGNFLNEVRAFAPELHEACKEVYKNRKIRKGHSFFDREQLLHIPAIAIEKAVFEKTGIAKVLQSDFYWKDIDRLEDLTSTEIRTGTPGLQVASGCTNTTIVNQCSRRAVVANGLEDIFIVNTKDAVYVGKNGHSGNLKKILQENPKLQPFFEKGRVTYRPWGKYELLIDEPNYRVKKVIINPGNTIYNHKHLYRSEHWSIVQGTARITMNDIGAEYFARDNVDVGADIYHQVSNIGLDPLIIIEVATGEHVSEEDMVSIQTPDLTESELGFKAPPFVKLSPAFKDYLWGGTKLRDAFDKNCDYDIIAESWELSAHPAGQSIVESGRHKGMLFGDYLDTIGKEYLGWKCKPMASFPVLVKFIDAKDDLSIQVHPDDDYALEVENEYGKSEMWYVVESEEGAGIYCGFNRDITKEEARERIRNNTIIEVLNWIPTKKGDVFFIPAGTVHAIGRGNLICEIQQSSNSTYRLYDYDRRDKFGNARELHLKKALDVLTYEKYEIQEFEDSIVDTPAYTSRILSQCKYFECMSYKIKEGMEIEIKEDSFMSIVCVDGSGYLCENQVRTEFKTGDSIFVTMGNRVLTVTGKCEIIITHI